MIPQDLPRALVAGGGSVTLVSSWGSDLDAVHTARCSFARYTVSTDSTPTRLNERDQRLLAYLWRQGHTSPFRHSSLKFLLHVPVFVLRQWQKHQVGSAWNEATGRYIALGQETHEPASAWRSAPGPLLLWNAHLAKTLGKMLTVAAELLHVQRVEEDGERRDGKVLEKKGEDGWVNAGIFGEG